MSVPNLGVTQLIQQQGPLGIASQGLGGLGQLMVQMEQMKQEKAKNDAYNAYMTELKTASEAERQRREAADLAAARDAKTTGAAFRQYMTPVQQQVNIPSIEGAFGVSSLPAQVNVDRERTMQEVMANLPAELVADFAKQVAPVEQTRQEKADAAKAKRGMESYLKTLPPSMREPMRAIVQLESAGVPANLSQFIVSGLVQEGAKDPKAIAAMRQKYPELAALPDAEVMQMGTELMLGQMRIRLGLARNPNLPPPGSAGGAPAGRTPAEIRAELGVLTPQVTNQRMLTGEAIQRPANLMLGRTGRPIVPRTAADSAAAVNDLRTLTDAQRALTAELQQAQGAPQGSLVNPGQGAVSVAPLAPTEVIGLDPATGRRVATDTTTGTRRYLDPPR